MSLLELVLLGFELCGTYALVPDALRKAASPGAAEAAESTEALETPLAASVIEALGCAEARAAARAGVRYSVAPMTSVARLKSYVERADGLHGAKTATRALAYVIDGAASPMEAKLAMLLSLPTRMGGYGLPKPLMNHRVVVGARAGGAAARSSYVCDLFWPEARLCVEYDSDEFHTGSRRISRDTGRRNALTHMGVTVIGVTRRQLMSRVEMDRVACAIARRIGHRFRQTKRNWLPERIKLRQALLLYRVP